jgi:hypothetical protein
LTPLPSDDEDEQDIFIRDQKAFARFRDSAINSNEEPMYEDLPRAGIELPKDKKSWTAGFERAGVTHLIHAWHEQGRGKKGSKVSYLTSF